MLTVCALVLSHDEALGQHRLGKKDRFYTIYPKVPASYTISNNVMNGIQWVPVEVTQTLPTGVQPASKELVAIFNCKPRDDWQRQSEAGAKCMSNRFHLKWQDKR
ncbi:hypothetical protein H2248_012174 [Termitomyces sp. 'cryptogamus']|nr:hypothetical protein H2248_012174 [Termitomyces sp. 'cryptogamus']